MECEGYKRGMHEVHKLYAKGYCEGCYMRKYRDEHRTEIIKYQKTYRADDTYIAMNRLYVARYRGNH